VESAIGGFNTEVRVQNEQGIGDSIDDARRPDVIIPMFVSLEHQLRFNAVRVSNIAN
jgi:hypothetical protein